MSRLAAPLLVAVLAILLVACDRVVDLTPSTDADSTTDADAGDGDAPLFDADPGDAVADSNIDATLGSD